jgi:hypothetical protein
MMIFTVVWPCLKCLPTSMLWCPKGQELHSTLLKWSKDQLEATNLPYHYLTRISIDRSLSQSYTILWELEIQWTTRGRSRTHTRAQEQHQRIRTQAYNSTTTLSHLNERLGHLNELLSDLVLRGGWLGGLFFYSPKPPTSRCWNSAHISSWLVHRTGNNNSLPRILIGAFQIQLSLDWSDPPSDHHVLSSHWRHPLEPNVAVEQSRSCAPPD